MTEYDYWSSKIDSVITKLKGKKFAIYPYGEKGKFVKEYLERKYGIYPTYLIDNFKAQTEESYITLDELVNQKQNELLVLLSSDARLYYKEIRTELKKYILHRNIIDLYPRKILVKRKITDRIFQNVRRYMLYPHGKERFLQSLKNSPKTRILDVGCGNKSPQYVKYILNKVYYVGIDVGNYNQTEESKKSANEYHIVESKDFVKEIEKYKESFDAVISSHNIEHCDSPERVLIAMINALKKGGKMYISFPSEESQYFPEGRIGCLNFYDDGTHQRVPKWDEILSILKKRGLRILFKTKRNRPYFMRKIGKLNEGKSEELKTVLMGTWEYYGFESIIWCQK